MRYVLLASLLLCGCAVVSRGVPGSGVVAHESRKVGSFTKFVLAGDADIELTAGADGSSCELDFDDNLLPFVVTEVVNDELRVHLSQAVSPSSRLKIKVSVPELKGVDLAGAADVTIQGLDQSTLTVSMAGSQKVSCQGKVESAHFKAAGSATLLAADLEAKSVSINITGSGSADVNASEKLSVNIAGSGTVRYLGEPQIDQSIAGSGKIMKKSLSPKE